VQSHAGVQFVNGQFMATIEVGIDNLGPVKFSNCGFWGTSETQSHVIKHGSSTLMLNGCHFTRWDSEGIGSPCVIADGGRLIINGCDFMEEDKQQVILENGLVAASIVGNCFRSSPAVTNHSRAQVEMGLNVQ
jgi:hypothetical protein